MFVVEMIKDARYTTHGARKNKFDYHVSWVLSKYKSIIAPLGEMSAQLTEGYYSRNRTPFGGDVSVAGRGVLLPKQNPLWGRCQRSWQRGITPETEPPWGDAAKRQRGIPPWWGLTGNSAIPPFTYLSFMSYKKPREIISTLPGWGLGQDDLPFKRTRLKARTMQRGTTSKTGMCWIAGIPKNSETNPLPDADTP